MNVSYKWKLSWIHKTIILINSVSVGQLWSSECLILLISRLIHFRCCWGCNCDGRWYCRASLWSHSQQHQWQDEAGSLVQKFFWFSILYVSFLKKIFFTCNCLFTCWFWENISTFFSGNCIKIQVKASVNELFFYFV